MTTETPIRTEFDHLRASFQARFLARVPGHIERLGWSRRQIEACQRDGLRALLGHAIAHSPFHRQRLRGIDPSRFELADLSSLPIMTKAQMMRSFDEVLTDRRLTRGLVEEALARTADEPVPILGEYTALASGGSSGVRGVFVSASEAVLGSTLSVTRPLMARLRAGGGAPPGGLPIAMVAAASAVHATGSATAWVVGEKLPFHFLPVPATLPVPEIVARLNALLAPGLFGYPSMLARLAAERRAGRLRIAPTSVTTAGETLTAELRAAIHNDFRAPIVDTFASTEGLFGPTAPNDDVCIFNSDLCIAELVDAENRPVPVGVPSAKVLVTNLYNRTQPLIRYELTDSFIREPDAADHGHLRARVTGRVDDILHYGGVDVHPHVVRSVMVKAAAVLEYQVRQTIDGIDVDTVVSARIDGHALSDRLEAALAAAGLAHPAVSVRIVDRLDRHAATGKLKRFVPLLT
jgi:phenylacetate-coenzyme A ligase PaaK-like adenylate-forming protein